MLKEIQDTMHQDAPSMAVLLGLNYETYRSYYYGRRATPPDVLELAEELLAADRAWMTDYKRGLDLELDARYP